MSSLLPILREKSPQMSMCSICPVPGACCKGFVLSHIPDGKTEGEHESPAFWLRNWKDQAAAWLEERGYDFVPATIHTIWSRESEPSSWVSVRFDCPHLLGSGRCGIYETRPRVCRQFTPLEDDLCKFPR